MATIKDIGIPGLGVGILQPLLKYRYRARFLNDKGDEELMFSSDIARQLISVTGFEQTRTGELAKFGLSSDRYHVGFEVEEDITCVASLALQRLFELESFTFMLEYLDGLEAVIKTATFYSCQVEKLAHGDLDYAGSPSARTYARLKMPMREGRLIEDLKESPAAHAVLTVLNGAEFAIDGQSHGRGTVQTVVSVTYESVEIHHVQVL